MKKTNPRLASVCNLVNQEHITKVAKSLEGLTLPEIMTLLGKAHPITELVMVCNLTSTFSVGKYDPISDLQDIIQETLVSYIAGDLSFLELGRIAKTNSTLFVEKGIETLGTQFDTCIPFKTFGGLNTKDMRTVVVQEI